MAQSEVTELVRAWYGGDATAGERLFPLVYEELKRVAAAQLRYDCATTLQPLALVS